MNVEQLELFGRTGWDFVIYDEQGRERFAARLFDDATTLDVLWTDNLPRTLVRLREVQRLAGGPGSFTFVVGIASDEFENLIRFNRFDLDQASRLLSQALGGEWRVQVVPRPETTCSIFDVIASKAETPT
jgi:hypothetical protein